MKDNKFFEETGKQLLVGIGVALVMKGFEIGLTKGWEYFKTKTQKTTVETDTSIRNDIKKAA